MTNLQVVRTNLSVRANDKFTNVRDKITIGTKIKLFTSINKYFTSATTNFTIQIKKFQSEVTNIQAEIPNLQVWTTNVQAQMTIYNFTSNHDDWPGLVCFLSAATKCPQTILRTPGKVQVSFFPAKHLSVRDFSVSGNFRPKKIAMPGWF